VDLEETRRSGCGRLLLLGLSRIRDTDECFPPRSVTLEPRGLGPVSRAQRRKTHASFNEPPCFLFLVSQAGVNATESNTTYREALEELLE
jgi:hypothetical protein